MVLVLLLVMLLCCLQICFLCFLPFSSEVQVWAFVFRHRFCFPPSSVGLLLYSVLLSVKFFLHREDFLCLSFVIFVTFVVRGLLSLAPSRPFLMVRFGFCSLSSGFWFPLSVLCFPCSSAFQRFWVWFFGCGSVALCYTSF